jgi:colicin import membrane protein
LHHPTTPQPELKRYAVWALVGHVVLLVLVSLVISESIRTMPAAAMQVRLVGIPQPSTLASKPKEPEKVRTQDSAAPKEPPPETKNIPPSEAKAKMLTKVEETVKDKENPLDAKKRPPVLDKTPREKKVVKNDKDAKVVKNPEDFLAALEFIDKLETQQLAPSPTATAKPTDEKAGEGPQIQLNLADAGAVDAIRNHIMQYWTSIPGQDVRGLQVVVRVSTDAEGNLTYAPRVITSSGNSAFDDSLVRAVRKAVPLPVPPNDEKFRVIDFTFAPEQ